MSEKPPFDPNAPFEEVREAKAAFDPSQHFDVPQQSRGPRFDFGKIKEDPLLGSAEIALQGMGSVADLVKAGADKVVAGVPLSESLDKYYKNDPTYTPGDATVEKFIPNNVMGQTVAKTALDIGSDPTTYGAFAAKGLSKGASKLASLIEQAEAKEPGFAMRTLGKLGEFFTGGRMGTKWAQSASKFTPLEQMTAGGTLKQASSEYAPMKSAADTIMSGRGTPEQKALFDQVKRFPDALAPATDEAVTGLTNPAFNKLDSAVQTLEDVVSKVERTEGAIPAKLQVLLDRAKSIKNRGVTSGPETAELMDAINNLEYTGFGNPRAVKAMMKGAQAEMRGGLSNLTEASSPAYSAARQRVSDAINMAAPPTGGKMSKYLLQNIPTVAGGVRSVQQAASGDIKGAGETAVATLLLRNPAAWNAVAGGARLAPNLMSKGVTEVSSFLMKHPEIMKAAKVALVQLPKTDFNKTYETLTAPNISKTLQENPQAFGRFSPILQQSSQRGPNALRATDHVLSTKGGKEAEEYRDMKRQLNGQEQPNQ